MDVLECRELTELERLQLEVADLRRQVEELSVDPTFGIYSRAGVDRRWHSRPAQADTLICMDLDDMHGLNSRLGYSEVDRRIARVFAQVGGFRFRWYSGDEFGIAVQAADSEPLIARLTELWRLEGMAATMVAVPILDDNLALTMQAGMALVAGRKARQQGSTR